jgi:hypothetical protein
MDNKDLLDDDLDWDAEINNWTDELYESGQQHAPVTMIKTFNTEQEADLAAAMLQGEGIDGRVVASITGGMTPFDFGNVRLFVATSQAAEAAILLRKMSGEQAVYDTPQTSATQILLIIMAGLFIIGLILTLAQKALGIL